MRGRQAIAGLYEILFRSVFVDASMEYEVSARRELCANSALLILRVEVSVPHGKMAGEHCAHTSMVLRQNGDGWAIASLQNTLVSGAAA